MIAKVEWRAHCNKGGRNRIASIKEIQQWRMDLPVGYAINKKRMKKFIEDKVKEANPDMDDSDIDISKNTVALYMQDCVFDEKIPSTVHKKVYNKTEKRYIAENSHRAIMCLACTLLLTHSIPTTDPSKMSTNTVEDKLLWYPHMWVNSMLGWNNDDSTFSAATLKKLTGVQVIPNPKPSMCTACSFTPNYLTIRPTDLYSAKGTYP